MRTTLDFFKLDNGKLGAINFNNMLPVTNKNIIELDLDKNCFTKEEKKYIKLLKEQLYWLNRNSEKIYTRATSLYDKYKNNKLAERIKSRCCNFILLEEKCVEYNK
jgi:protein AbiQ